MEAGMKTRMIVLVLSVMVLGINTATAQENDSILYLTISGGTTVDIGAAGIRSGLDKPKAWEGHCGYPPVVRSCVATQDSWRACPPPRFPKFA